MRLLIICIRVAFILLIHFAFMWAVVHSFDFGKLDRLPHRLNLSSRGIEIPGIYCPSCNSNVESKLHIFFECDIAKEIGRLVRVWCDASIPLFASNNHWRDWLNSWHVPKEKIHRLYIIIVSSLW